MKNSLFALALCFLGTGCGMSPTQVQAVGISVAADLTAGGEEAIDHAVRADLHNTCPTLADTCVATVRANWAPVDVAANAVVAALTAWDAALDIAREAGVNPGAAVLHAARALVAAYENLRETLHALHIEISPLPAAITALIPLETSPLIPLEASST